MLLSLHIRNYVLIDSLDVDFPEGLVIITGQTGAGKSILLGALSFLAGAKADASMITPGASSCVVEAEFESRDERIAEILAAEDIEPDGSRMLVRRVMSASGRSRSFINDCPVPLGVLQSISSLLVDIHSQHKSLLLMNGGFQLSVLDGFAGNSEKLSGCRAAWRRLQTVRTELSDVRTELARLRAEKDYDSEQLARLTEARLESGELESLEEEQKKELLEAKHSGDSIGATAMIVVKNMPLSLGEPLYYRLDQVLCGNLMGLNAVKAVQIGSGVESSRKRGSQINDSMSKEGFLSNHSGGILGGISNGEDIVIKVHFKPTPSIFLEQKSIDIHGNERMIKLQGRHDPCVGVRGSIVCESIAAMVLADMLMLNATSRLDSLKRIYKHHT